MLAACPISDALRTRIPADEEPLCGNVAAYAMPLLLLLLLLLLHKQTATVHVKICISFEWIFLSTHIDTVPSTSPAAITSRFGWKHRSKI